MFFHRYFLYIMRQYNVKQTSCHPSVTIYHSNVIIKIPVVSTKNCHYDIYRQPEEGSKVLV
jgi:hypothetical protein